MSAMPPYHQARHHRSASVGDRPDEDLPAGTEEDAVAPRMLPDLVVLSHLRWTWVWQRPQHLVSRFAQARAAAGARTWFVEEPVAVPAGVDLSEPELRWEDVGDVTRVWLLVPYDADAPAALSFDAAGAEQYGDQLAALFAAQQRPGGPDVLLYTPLADPTARRLQPQRVAYDVMDDLAAFANAPQGLRLAQRRLLADADVVFAGGRSLHRAMSAQRPRGCHLFPSGVETGHYRASRQLRDLQEPRERRVAGYVGVIDERLDLDLLGGLAEALPDWTVRVVGPVATKIDASDLPRAANLEYPGMVPYAELPAVMAGFDVALMPFARNEATRSISPTKTLEYLAAGLPVVSTRITDVVADYSGVVHLADETASFAAACREVVGHSRQERDRRLRPIQARHEWDVIAAAMGALLDGTDADADAASGLAAGAVTA